jgi:hypothetical protein
VLTITLLYQPAFRIHGATTFIPFGGLISSVSVAVTGLSPITSYDFQVVASNSFGSTPSAIVVASTTAVNGAPPPGSVGGSQTSGAVNPIVAGPANGTVLKSGTLAVTGVTISSNSFFATPGVGSFTAGGHVYTISTTNNTFTVDGTAIVAGSQTAAIEYYNGNVYAQDASSGSWYTWDGVSNFVAAATPPSPQFTLTITATTGTVSMTSGGVPVSGSGTTSITFVSTLSVVQTAVATVTFTAPAVVTSANVKVAAFDPTNATNSITIPIGVVAATPPAPPTNLVVT